MKPLISVIIPVYNGEKYLSQTVESVLYQSFDDFELLLIDDGSTDNSKSIIDFFQKKDNRVRCVYKSNTGVSDTRNRGIALANGDYIYFADADDILHKDILLELKRVIECGYDIAVCNYLTFRDKCHFETASSNSRIVNIKIDELLNKGLMTSACIKLISKKLLLNYDILFDINMTYGEDLFFCLKSCFAAKKIGFVDKKLYAYRLGNGATSKYHPDLYEHYKVAYNDIKQFGIKHDFINDNDILMLDIDFTKKVVSFAKMIALKDETIKQKNDDIKLILNDSTITNIVNNHLSELTINASSDYFNLVKNKKTKRLLFKAYIDIIKSKIANIIKY